MFSSAEKVSAATHERSCVKKPESLVRTHGDGLACGSVVGPPNLKSVAAIHRKLPTIPPGPPRNGPDVTQIKKIRQHLAATLATFSGIQPLKGAETNGWSVGGRCIHSAARESDPDRADALGRDEVVVS